MKPSGDDPDTNPDLATEPAQNDSRQMTVQDLPGYELGDVLGRGGMGEVVVAFDHEMEREVALKRMRARPTEDLVKRFRREAKVQARLDHPAIVPVHELGTDAAGNPYFTMKRLVGSTLADALAKQESMQRLLRAFVDVCFAIELAHERGVVHRDLKPSNVMLGNYGDVYVIDWGVARIMSNRRTSTIMAVADTLAPDETAAGVVLGTPGYIAPEQLKGQDVGPAADVFSLGAILFEILAGEPLHPHGKDAIRSTLIKPGDSPIRRRPDRGIAPELDAVCVAALAEEPEDRLGARELAERVESYLDGDRDLEHRRALAKQQIAHARAALEDPARSIEAGQAATRALALDPESAEAAQLVAQLILKPPHELTPALVAELEASERDINYQRGRIAMFAFLSLYTFLPVFLIFQSVKDWFQLALVYAAATLMAALQWHNARTGRTSTWLLLLANFTLAFMFMRLTGTFILSAALVCGQALALATRSQIAHRPWMLVIWIIVTLSTPVALEYFGVIERTWWMSDQGITNHGTVIRTVRELDVFFLLLGQIALALVVGLFSLSTTRAREDAQRRAHIQAWHLQQLIPRGRASSIG